MEDSFIIANFHTLCRLCLHKSTFAMSLFSAFPDDSTNNSVTSKISDCFELQMDPNDGLPGKICYKCLFKLEKCAEFRKQCIESETRLKQITNEGFDSSKSSDFGYSYNSQDTLKTKSEDYLVEDSVVMVVDPSVDYDSTEDSDNGEQGEQEVSERVNTPEAELPQESFFRNIAMCQFCDQAFVTVEKCKEHEQMNHDPNLPYKCVECSIVFAERSQYVQHSKQVHGNDKPYQCPECDKCFGRRSDLRKHSIVHTGIRPYQCQYCFKSFSRNTNLSKHLRIHAGHKPHICPICPRSFVAKGDLQRHVIIHSGMKPFACKKCPLTFGRRDKLIRHELRHGAVAADYQVTDLDNDMESHNMIVNVNPFSNIITSPTQMSSDASNANYELPSVPEHISGESFSQSQKGTKMMQMSKSKLPSSRNKPKNIKCHQCPKRFSSLDAYKTHVSIAHIGSRGFQCKVCFKKFTRKKELDRHSLLHSGMKPFSCNQCDKKFTRKDKLNKHQQSHEISFTHLPCIECGSIFEKKEELVAHIKSHFTESYKDSAEIKKENDEQDEENQEFYD